MMHLCLTLDLFMIEHGVYHQSRTMYINIVLTSYIILAKKSTLCDNKLNIESISVRDKFKLLMFSG